MAAWLSNVLGVPYLTPQTAGGQAGGETVAAIWKKIHEYENATPPQPLPADLAEWKAKVGATRA